MATIYAPSARLIWSLASSGLTTLAGAGNSGAWSNANLNGASKVDLRDVVDVTLMVSVGAIVTSPSLVATLFVFDDLGNAYSTGLTTTAITAAGSQIVSGGLHGLSGKQLALPAWGQVAWTLTGGSVTGTEISLWGR